MRKWVYSWAIIFVLLCETCIVYAGESDVTTITDNVLYNLEMSGIAMLLFLGAYVANMAFSIYYNIEVLDMPWSWKKIGRSGKKVATFLVGLILICVVITTLPEFADYIGWTIPDTYREVFADIVIISAVLVVTCKYIKEAVVKFRAILSGETSWVAEFGESDPVGGNVLQNEYEDK